MESQHAVGAFIRFRPRVGPKKIAGLFSARRKIWEDQFPGSWTEIHIRPAGDDKSWGLALTRKFDGDNGAGFGRAILADMRTAWGVDDRGRPNHVKDWSFGGDIFTLPLKI